MSSFLMLLLPVQLRTLGFATKLLLCCVFFCLQFDNLKAAHETSKLEIEASHSDEIKLLKKVYETSLSGKDVFFFHLNRMRFNGTA